MKKITIFFSILVFQQIIFAQQSKDSLHAGYPLFGGWVDHSEATIFSHSYWIYPDNAAPNKKVFYVFSSPELVHWTKHNHVLDTLNVVWAKRAVWAND